MIVVAILGFVAGTVFGAVFIICACVCNWNEFSPAVEKMLEVSE